MYYIYLYKGSYNIIILETEFHRGDPRAYSQNRSARGI